MNIYTYSFIDLRPLHCFFLKGLAKGLFKKNPKHKQKNSQRAL